MLLKWALSFWPCCEETIPQSQENPELLVVASKDMKGDFYYPVPYATQKPHVQLPYYPHQMPMIQCEFNPDQQFQYSCIQLPYIIPYEEQIPSPGEICLMPQLA